MDEQDRKGPENTNPVEGEGVPIPSRIRMAVDDVRRRVNADVEHDVVSEYEERYYGSRKNRLETPEEIQGVPPVEKIKAAPYKSKRRFSPAELDANERKWAALAHASTLLTALVGLFSAGSGVLLTMFVPLLIYFSFRKRSEYVAYHALQAFTIQLVGTIGWLVLLISGVLIWVALFFVSILLMLVLIGFVLAPILLLLLPVFILASLALPLGMVIYSVIALVETHSGNDYRFPYIGRWVDNQMHGGMLNF